MDKQCVCVTGGYGSLGRNIARAFIDNGDQVLLTGRNEKRLNAVAAELKCDAFVHDVTHIEDAKILHEYIMQKYKKLDISS